MVFCCAPGCKSRGGKFKRGSQTFHRFPAQPLLREKWAEAVARVGWRPNNSRLCSLHFEDADYEDAEKGLKRARLKSGAVPSVFYDTALGGEGRVQLEADDFAKSTKGIQGGNSIGFLQPKNSPQYWTKIRAKEPFEKDACINIQFWTLWSPFRAVLENHS